MKKTYYGTKKINAWPMTRAEYNQFRGWELPANENGADEGYLVEYLDVGKPNVEGYAGYVSWSPKEQFDAAYQPISSMSFGHAVAAMKAGHRVARAGWNGSGMFAYLVPAASYPAQTEVAKAYWADRQTPHPENSVSAIMVPYRAYLALKTAQDDIATWSPSTSDALADDWYIVEENEAKAAA